MMTKHLARRLRRLELCHAIVEIPKFVVGTTTIDAERRASLTAGERIVWDWVSDMDGFVVARERITCDPADQGLRGTPVTTWSSSYRWKDPEITPDEDPSFREATVLELLDLQTSEFDLALTGFDTKEIDDLILDDTPVEDAAPPLPRQPVTRSGDLWLCGPHRVLCGDATDPEVVSRLLDERQPFLMVTDPPYGIELDSEWRDRAGLNGRGPAEPSYLKHRTQGHRQTSISGDTRADWSEAFALVPSLEVGYVWHASKFTREVLDGLLRIGFLHHQQIIWDKGRAVLTRTHYWFQHEPCWYVRKKNAPWFGKPGENSTIWNSPSPKFIMGGSDEEKFDHPTQKPVDLMRRPILNHTKPGDLVYEPFLGSGTTLAAAEVTQRICFGLELDPQYADVVVERWQGLTGRKATLEGDGRTFEAVAQERVRMAA